MDTVTIVRLAATCVLLLFLYSCGGGEMPRPGDATATARVSLRVAAEPIEWVDEVVLQIRGVTFVRREDGRETYYKPERVVQASLMSAGPVGSMILPEITLPAGEYTMIRVDVDASENVSDSYVRSLRGEECELRVSSSRLVAHGHVDLRQAQAKSVTVVADIRRALRPTNCVAGYFLQSGHDFVDDEKAGWFTGSVDSSLVPAECEPKVYVFIQGATLEDVADVVPPREGPVSVAGARMQEGVYRYRTRALLPVFVLEEHKESIPACQFRTTCLRPASYLLAFTCDVDDPVVDEDVRFKPFAALLLQGGIANEASYKALSEGVR